MSKEGHHCLKQNRKVPGSCSTAKDSSGVNRAGLIAWGCQDVT